LRPQGLAAKSACPVRVLALCEGGDKPEMDEALLQAEAADR